VYGVEALGDMCNLCSAHLDVVLPTNHFELIVGAYQFLPRRLFISLKIQSVTVVVTAFFKQGFPLPVLRGLFLMLKLRLVTIEYFFFSIN
jgi:hypothetical protein